MSFIDKEKNNIAVAAILIGVIFLILFFGGRFTHEMYETWKKLY